MRAVHRRRRSCARCCVRCGRVPSSGGSGGSLRSGHLVLEIGISAQLLACMCGGLLILLIRLPLEDSCATSRLAALAACTVLSIPEERQKASRVGRE